MGTEGHAVSVPERSCLSHQVGSFLGVWLGGRLFDLTGSYTAMWWISVALGLARMRWWTQ